MSFIPWLLVGLISGFIANRVVDHHGSSRNMALGVLGAFVGGLMFHLIGQTGVTGLNVSSIFVSLLGASAVLVGYHALVGRPSRA